MTSFFKYIKKYIAVILIVLVACSLVPGAFSTVSAEPVTEEQGSLTEEFVPEEGVVSEDEEFSEETEPDEDFEAEPEEEPEEDLELMEDGEESGSGEDMNPGDNKEPDEPPTEKDPEEKEEKPKELKKGKPGRNPLQPTFLFIGNSMTYMNNLPEMFAHITWNAAGVEANYTTLVCGGKTPGYFAKRIKAVIRTGGDDKFLTDSEKALFVPYGTSGAANYDADIFNYFKNVIVADDETLAAYDYIVIQDSTSDFNVTPQETASLCEIVDMISTDYTTILINEICPYYNPELSLEGYKQIVDGKDACAEALCAELTANHECEDARVAYTGRAVANYYLYNGIDGAQYRAPEEYSIYTRKCNGVATDLIIADTIHPTQLGTYLFASVIFSSVYYTNPATSISGFKGYTRGYCFDLRRMQNGTNYAIQNGDIGENNLLKMAVFIAAKTQLEGMSLQSVEEAEQLKADGMTDYYAYTLPVPTLKKPTAGSNSITISWDKVDNAYKYLVYRKNAYGWQRIGTTRNTYFTDSGRAPLSTYTYTVRCISSAEDRVLSMYDEEGVTARTVLPAPVITKQVNRADGIRVNWSAVDGAAKYKLYRRTSGTSWKLLTTTTKCYFTDTKAVEGRTYYYKARAVEADGTLGAMVDPAKTITRLLKPAVAAKQLKAGSPVIVKWSPVKGARKYYVYRKLGSGSWKLIKKTGYLVCKDTTALKGKNYSYYVRAAASNGSLSQAAVSTDGVKIKVK